MERIVLGIFDNKEIDSRLISFKKYFQRIKNQVPDIKYKILDSSNDIEHIYFFGTSMSKNDEDILHALFNVSCEISIFYKDEKDYEEKVYNLIEVFKRDKIEKAIGSGVINFVEIM